LLAARHLDTARKTDNKCERGGQCQKAAL